MFLIYLPSFLSDKLGLVSVIINHGRPDVNASGRFVLCDCEVVVGSR
jgi:hypothetical protein